MQVSDSKLNYVMYNAARGNVDERYRKDKDAVIEFQEQQSLTMFGRNTDLLTPDEKSELIQHMQDLSGYKSKYRGKSQQAEKEKIAKMVARFQYYSMLCAFYYIEKKNLIPDLHLTLKTTGEILQGKALIDYLRKDFKENNRHVPRNIWLRIQTDFINPTSNKWLVEGKYKSRVQSPNSLYVNSLKPGELDYLIQRFEQMWNNLNVGFDPDFTEEIKWEQN